MDVSLILDDLNDEQRSAVAAPLGNMLVLAGAGSGKTRVLARRIAWLIATEGISPYGLVALTFTNKAAREMRQRIHALLDLPARELGSMWVGTFHGIAHRLLRHHWQEAGLEQNFQIIDAGDQKRLLRRIINELGLDIEQWPVNPAMGFINRKKDAGLRAEHIQPDSRSSETFVRIYTAYEQVCAANNLVDFAELLLRSHELWLGSDALLQTYRQRFTQLLVDEFQDTNAVQYAWLRMLAGTSGQVMAVGDDDQSIYGWRGSKVEHVYALERDFSDLQVVRLEQNYRSTNTILKAANALIAGNRNRLGKNLWSEGEEGAPILLYEAYNEQDEARFIAGQIQEFMDQGNSPAAVAVLYRINSASRNLEEAMIEQGIPYRIYGGQRFFERQEIRDALGYLRLMADRNSDVAFERVVNTPSRGIGDKTLQQLQTHARQHGVSLSAAAGDLLANNALPGRGARALGGFLQLINTLDADTQSATLEETVRHVVVNSGLHEYHGRKGGEQGLSRQENLQELISAAGIFESDDQHHVQEDAAPPDTGRTLLEQFLILATLEAGEGAPSAESAAVQLMTLHAAKGLEFPLVFIAGFEDGLLPHSMCLSDPSQLEEERRLCYVGMTRAMQQLYITCARMRRIHGGPPSMTRTSRFLTEIPEQLLRQERSGRVTVRPPAGRRRAAATPARSAIAGDADNESVAAGRRVRHGKFGTGKVLQCEGAGDRRRALVYFESVGSKWLMLTHARLELI